jgi:hypothetical protein
MLAGNVGTTLRQLCGPNSPERPISEVLQADTLRSLSKGDGLESRPASLGQTDNCQRKRKKGSQDADPTRICSDWNIRVSVKLGEPTSGGRRRNGPQNRGLTRYIRDAADWRGAVQPYGRLPGQGAISTDQVLAKLEKDAKRLNGQGRKIGASPRFLSFSVIISGYVGNEFPRHLGHGSVVNASLRRWISESELNVAGLACCSVTKLCKSCIVLKAERICP